QDGLALVEGQATGCLPNADGHGHCAGTTDGRDRERGGDLCSCVVRRSAKRYPEPDAAPAGTRGGMGYQMQGATDGLERASDLNDERPKLKQLLIKGDK